MTPSQTLLYKRLKRLSKSLKDLHYKVDQLLANDAKNDPMRHKPLYPGHGGRASLAPHDDEPPF